MIRTVLMAALLSATRNSNAFDLNAGIKESNQRKHDDLRNQLDEVPVCQEFEDAVKTWGNYQTAKCNIKGYSVLGHSDISPALCEEIRTNCNANLYAIAKERGCSE